MAEILKIYKHVNAQAQIKVKIGEDKEGDPIFQNVRFTGGRTLGTKGNVEAAVEGGRFDTKIESLQKAIEKRKDFGRLIFIDHKLEEKKIASVASSDFKVFPDVETINAVKGVLKKEFKDQVKGEDLRGTEEMLKFANRVGAAFPDFFVVDHAQFKKEEKKEVVIATPEVPEVHEETADSQEGEEFEEVEVDPDKLKEMSREDLNAEAITFGVKNPEKLPNKGAVIKEILKQ